MKKNKVCHGCPVNPHTEQGMMMNAMGCLPCFGEALKWYKDTGKVWACHEKPTKPCIGFLQLCKEKEIPISVNKNTTLITEETTLEEIYEK